MSTGARPPELTAAITGERSTTAGMMKLHSAGGSTTFTGRPRAVASAATRAFSGPSSVAAIGLRYGRWLYRFVQRLPERLIKERYGILSADIGRALLAKRLLRRAAFRAVDNPATRGILRALGATNGTRSSLSDFYYFLIFRRNLLVGYSEAKRGLWPGA